MAKARNPKLLVLPPPIAYAAGAKSTKSARDGSFLEITKHVL